MAAYTQVLIKFFTEVDKALIYVVNFYGYLIYPLLFLVIFLETGVVIFPFLPGDSLIFASGTLAASGLLNVYYLFIILSLAAILGDSLNYFIGKYIGNKIINHKWIKKEYITETQEFYNKHGGKTIILARFVPIVRTFAPFVAGIGKMNYSKFISYNIFGGILWVGIFVFAGYFFGNIPFVKDNLTLVLLLVIFASLIPILIGFIRNRLKKRRKF